MTDPDETAAQQPPTMAADAAIEGATQSINAWSLEEATDDVTPYEDIEVEHRSWKVPAIVAAVAVIAAGVGVGIWWNASKSTPAPPVAAAPTSVAPPANSAPQTPDQRFVDLLRKKGFMPTGTDAQATMSARQICSGLTSGQFTFAQAVTGVEKGSGVSNANATLFAQTAIDVYCPSYQKTS